MKPDSVKYKHVIQAIAEYDRFGRDEFLKKYGYGKSRQYLLLHQEKTYDSKPIYGVAHGFATGEVLTHKDFSGGIAGAAGYLQNIGFEIVDVLTTGPDGTDRNYWALFANPRIYKIQDAINELSHDLWVTKGRQISFGDRVLIWKGTGNDGWRGVVAFGDVINDPAVTTDPENPYWKNPTDGLSPEERVRVSYVTMPSLPLRYGSAQWDVLNELSISRARGGTAFKVETDTWGKLISAVGGWPSEAITPSAQYQPYEHVDPASGAGKSNSYNVDPDAVDRATKAHKQLQEDVAGFLQARGIDPLSPKGGRFLFDIGWTEGSVTKICEIKSFVEGNEERQLRLAVGQILRYAQQFRPNAETTEVKPTIVVEYKPPDDSWIELMDELEILIAWPGSFDRLLDYIEHHD